MTDMTSPVGSWVAEKPQRSRVFEALKIDYCCGGKVSLEEACRKRRLDPEEVVRMIRDSDADAGPSPMADADAMTLSELADHIEQTHHAFLRDELPRLDFMTDKVARVHGDHDPRLHRVRAAFVDLRRELEPHMMKEERILFPMVRQLEASGSGPEPHGGTVADPIRQMEHEHDQAGEALAILREATDDFVPPEWACNTYRAMLDALQRLEGDMHIHVHKENNVLFPKAIELEASR